MGTSGIHYFATFSVFIHSGLKNDAISILSIFISQMMNHLVNHLCHFPMGVGASRLNSSVSEFHDVIDISLDDLKSDIFTAPNVQVSFHLVNLFLYEL